MGRTVGIDLGTTNSVVAYVQTDRIETIVNSEGAKTTPSIVLFSSEEVIVGDLAKRQLVTQPGMVVRSAKRLMGRRFSEVSDHLDEFPFQIVEGENDRAEILLDDGRRVPPELVSAQVLIKMRDTAEDYFGEGVDSAVITVPAHFNDSQRTATKRAAELAQLNVLRIVNEPTAAALAYGFGTGNRRQKIAVFDFGGGTFDVSILQIDEDIFEVLSTNGDTQLGGDNIDQKLFEEISDAILQQTGIDPRIDRTATSRIREAAEKTKIELSSMKSTRVSLPFIVSDSQGPKHYDAEITRDEFNRWMAPLFERLFEPCRQALTDAHVALAQLDDVILVGGSTRIPRVQEMVEQFFGRVPNRSVNPDEAIGMGAAVQAGVMRGELAELLLLDVTPLSLGIELAGGVFKPLIERNSSIPCEATRKFTTVVDNQQNVMVHVLQGERMKAGENRSIARFRLTGILPMPKELPEIEVTFRIDADGILEVSAVDLTSGVSAGVQVEGYGELAAMSPEEVQRLLEEVQKHSKEDEEFVRTATRRSQAERVQGRLQNILDKAGDIITEGDMKRIKETMLRHDLALAAREWMLLDQQESLLHDYIDKYEGMEEVHRALNRELDVSRSSMQIDIGPLQAMTEMPRPSPAAPPPKAAQVVANQRQQSSRPAPAPAARQAAPAAAAPQQAAPEPEREPAPPPPPAGGAKKLTQASNAFGGDDFEDGYLPPPPPPA